MNRVVVRLVSLQDCGWDQLDVMLVSLCHSEEGIGGLMMNSCAGV